MTLILAAEIENILFSNTNCDKTLKVSFLRQVLNINEKYILDSKSIIRSKADLNNIDNNDKITTLLDIDVKKSQKIRKKDKNTSCITEKEQDNLVDEIFDYIYIT